MPHPSQSILAGDGAGRLIPDCVIYVEACDDKTVLACLEEGLRRLLGPCRGGRWRRSPRRREAWKRALRSVSNPAQSRPCLSPPNAREMVPQRPKRVPTRIRSASWRGCRVRLWREPERANAAVHTSWPLGTAPHSHALDRFASDSRRSDPQAPVTPVYSRIQTLAAEGSAWATRLGRARHQTTGTYGPEQGQRNGALLCRRLEVVDTLCDVQDFRVACFEAGRTKIEWRNELS